MSSSNGYFYLYYLPDGVWDCGHVNSALSLDVAALLESLNYTYHTYWIEHLASAADGASISSFKHPRADDSKRIYYLESVLIARGVDVQQLISLVGVLCDAGVEISDQSVLSFLEYVTVGAIIMGPDCKASLYHALLHETDHGGRDDSSDDSYEWITASRSNDREVLMSTTDGEEEAPAPATVNDLLFAMNSFLGFVCLAVGTGLAKDAGQFAHTWHTLVAHYEHIVDDVDTDDDEQRNLVRQMLQKFRCLHELIGSAYTTALFPHQGRYRRASACETKPAYHELMSDGFDVGAIALTLDIPPLGIVVPERRLLSEVSCSSQLASHGQTRGDLPLVLHCWHVARSNTHASTLLTDIVASSFTSGWHRDFTLPTCKPGAKFTLRAEILRECGGTLKGDDASVDQAEFASVCVDKWLLMARFPWFRSLILSGLEESRTNTMTFSEPMHPYALFFIAATIYMQNKPMERAIARNKYWRQGRDVCAACGMTPIPGDEEADEEASCATPDD